MDENGIKADYEQRVAAGPIIDWEKALTHVDSGSEALIRKDTVKMAQVAKYAPENVLTRAVPLLLQLLGQDTFSFVTSPTIHESVAYCLICFMKNNESLATVLVDSGAVMTIVSLLERSESLWRILLVKLLWYMLTFESKSRQLFSSAGGLQAVIALIGSCRDGSRKYLLEILSMLALSQGVWRSLSRSGGMQFLVEVAKHGSMLSRERACYAIGLLGVTNRGKLLLVELGVVPVLIQLLRDGAAKLVAGNALGIVMAHVDHIRIVAQAGAVPLYSDLLRGPDSMEEKLLRMYDAN